MTLYETGLLSPVGELTLIASEGALVALLWPDDDPARVRLPARQAGLEHPVLTAAAQQLGEYFSGVRRSFDLPLDPQGTPFQRDVWTALASIPFGETRSYGAIAAQIGRPSASRAVGAANGRNPLSIIVPCHRVIGKAGGLTGFAGGMETKAWLLSFESR
ncbi:methylated-DNA--[protein]-cysteine S-methyltransferase [Sphingobium olei]|uniref:Methylated-DNA--protein-cysteine methyltransferase n=1 Tax=Sphingobium olei TaxID=420955 RepID=A0ABW3P836_9SPHN